jgi:hypothetical protein
VAHQLDDPTAITEIVVDAYREILALRRSQDDAGWELATRPDQRFPPRFADIVEPALVESFEQQDLGCATGVAMQRETGRQYACRVENQQIAGLEQVGQIAHDAVLGWTGAPVDEQPRRVSLGQRMLGDRGDRKVIVEGGGLHGSFRLEGATTSFARVQGSNIDRVGSAVSGAPVGATSPRCAHAAGVATRPRGVRMSRPCWMRNGS